METSTYSPMVNLDNLTIFSAAVGKKSFYINFVCIYSLTVTREHNPKSSHKNKTIFNIRDIVEIKENKTSLYIFFQFLKWQIVIFPIQMHMYTAQ